MVLPSVPQHTTQRLQLVSHVRLAIHAARCCRASPLPAVVCCQMLGRGLRIMPGKKDCLVLDFTDKYHQVSLPRPCSNLWKLSPHCRSSRASKPPPEVLCVSPCACNAAHGSASGCARVC